MRQASWRWVSAAVLALVLGGTVAACGSDDDSSTSTSSTQAAAATTGASTGASTQAAADCTGDPVKIVSVSNTSSPLSSQTPEFGPSAAAAAKAATDECTLGAPVEVIDCDDKFTPNGAAACARKAVSEKAAAAVTYSGFGDSILPILQAAKIPSLNNATSSSENSSPDSFPTAYPITTLFGELSLAAGAGAKSVVIVTYDIPSVKFFTQLAAAQAATLGMKVMPAITFAPTETDMASYAGQVIDSKADAYIPIVGAPQELGLAKALRQQGADLSKSPLYISGLNNQTPAFVKQLGDSDGLLSVAWAWSPSATDNPAIAQYLKEMEAAGASTDPSSLTIQGVTAWASVHVAVDTMKAVGENTGPGLAEGLNGGKAPDTTKYGLAPIDFTKPAFPQGPLAKLRLFSSSSSAWKFDASGVPQPLGDGWFSVLKPFDMGAAG